MNNCVKCSKEFEGRSNQKFCSMSCKNSFHNRNNKDRESKVIKINKVLHRNWATLHKLYEVYRSAPISMEIVKAYGFDNSFFTHIHHSPMGEKYTMAYDIGFKRHIDDQIQIIVAQD